nr:Transcriptional regulatory protein, C terminal [uncultured bacterium]
MCRAIRRESEAPVIILTAKGDEMDRIVGLELGADDYVVKPFSPRELVARVRAVLRRGATRAQPSESGSAVRFGDLYINPKTRSVEVRRRSVVLTAKEFDLLYFLASFPGQVFTRDQLMNQVWDFAYVGDTSTVTVHIRRLREKIEADPERPAFLKTVWGVGYKFEAERGSA